MALLSHCKVPENIPLIYRQETGVLSTNFCSWEFLIFMTQCPYDTLNASADKLLLSSLIKLGGYNAISGRYDQSLQLHLL